MVNIVVTSLGVLLYIALFVLAASSHQCPYQTPFSLVMRYLIELDEKHSQYIPRFLSLSRKVLVSSTSYVKSVKIQLFNRFNSRLAQPEDEEIREEMQLERRLVTRDAVQPLFEMQRKESDRRNAELQDHSLNAACICWILETSTDPEVTSAAIRWIPTVEWHDGVTVEPSLRLLYNAAFPGFYSFSVSIPDKVFAPLQAFVHLITQRPRGRAATPQADSDQQVVQLLQEEFGPLQDILR